MSAIIKLVTFIIWAAVIPTLTGLLPVSFLKKDDRKPHILVIAGYLTTFALFELVGIPVLFYSYTGNFLVLKIVFAIASLAVVFAGGYRCIKTGGIQPMAAVREKDPEGWIALLLFVLILGFELFKAYTTASYDGDDAYYVAQSLQTYQTGTMYHFVPYTGATPIIAGRHAMAMIPMWITFLAEMAGTHPTIVTHSMMPLVFLPLADLCIYGLLRELFANEPEDRRCGRIWGAMAVVAAMQVFGASSIYTPEVFLLTRTWQGKTVFVNIVIPLAFWILLSIGHHFNDTSYRKFGYMMIIALNLTAGFCTSLAPFLLTGFLVAGSILLGIFYRDRKIVRGVILCCIPNVIYGVLLLRLVYWNYFQHYFPWWWLPSEHPH